MKRVIISSSVEDKQRATDIMIKADDIHYEMERVRAAFSDAYYGGYISIQEAIEVVQKQIELHTDVLSQLRTIPSGIEFSDEYVAQVSSELDELNDMLMRLSA